MDVEVVGDAPAVAVYVVVRELALVVGAVWGVLAAVAVFVAVRVEFACVDFVVLVVAVDVLEGGGEGL